MKTAGWIRIELKAGRPKWHCFIDEGRYSLCGKTHVYCQFDKVLRHITEGGNCLLCAKILKKKGGE